VAEVTTVSNNPGKQNQTLGNLYVYVHSIFLLSGIVMVSVNIV
jgi:hypothetical protein